MPISMLQIPIVFKFLQILPNLSLHPPALSCGPALWGPALFCGPAECNHGGMLEFLKVIFKHSHLFCHSLELEHKHFIMEGS